MTEIVVPCIALQGLQYSSNMGLLARSRQSKVWVPLGWPGGIWEAVQHWHSTTSRVGHFGLFEKSPFLLSDPQMHRFGLTALRCSDIAPRTESVLASASQQKSPRSS